MISIYYLLPTAFCLLPTDLDPGLPLSNNLFVNLDAILLNRAWNDIGRIIEAPSLNSLKGLKMPFGGACIAYDFFIIDMESSGLAWLAHAHCCNHSSGLCNIGKEGNDYPITFVLEIDDLFLLHNMHRDGDFPFFYFCLDIGHANRLSGIVHLFGHLWLRRNFWVSSCISLNDPVTGYYQYSCYYG